MNIRTLNRKVAALLAAGLVTAVVAGCGGGSSSQNNGATPTAGASASGQQVLPVAQNPITNAATAPGLTITKALVENNVSPTTGKAVDDHLEVALKNTSSKPLDQVEIYYKITDPSKNVSEGYHAKLAGFTIDPGATRVAHFDSTGETDSFPVNKYSLYYTDKNALVVDITASAKDVKPATFSVKKDAGGAEAGVE